MTVAPEFTKNFTKNILTWQQKGYLTKALVWLWILLLVFSVVLSILGAPYYYQYFQNRVLGRHVSLLYVWLGTNASTAIFFFTAACWLIVKHPSKGMPLMAAYSLLCFGNNMAGFADAYVVFNPNRPDFVAFLFFLQRVLTNVLSVCFVLLLPTGKFQPYWTKYYAYAWIGISLLFLCFPDMPLNYMYGKTLHKYAPYSYVFLMLVYTVPTALLVYKFFFFPKSLRKQMRWIVIGLVAVLFAAFSEYGFRILYSINFFPLNENGLVSHAWFHSYARPILTVTGFNVFPVMICIALAKDNPWRTDPLVRRILLYTSLTVSVLLIYISIVGFLGWIFNQQFGFLSSFLATGVVAILFHPIQLALRQRINYMLYGRRDDPYTVLKELSLGMEDAVDTQTTLDNFCESTANVLKLPFMGIWLDEVGNRPIASFGKQANSDIINFPLSYESETLGLLRVSRRVAGEVFTQSELILLKTIAQHVSIICHNYLLAEALQNSREQIVRGREEERKRIRRDLHDGLGPTLASTALQLETARKLIYTKPEQGDTILKNLENKMSQTLTDVRTLVHDLYPSLIDQFGLVEALRQELESFESEALKVTFSVTGEIDDLGAATEVAVYRIVKEAVHNVHKHAQATRCEVNIDCSGEKLKVIIQDNGVGLKITETTGIGLQSICERTEELGGSFQIVDRASHGLKLSVQLPLLLKR